MRRLPKGWSRAPLSEVTHVNMGQSPPSSAYNNAGRGLPFLQGKAEFGALRPTPVKWCTSPKKVAEADDVLVSVRAPVGPTNLSPTRCCIGRGLAALRPLGGLVNRFLLYQIRAREHELESLGHGVTFRAIRKKELASWPTLVCPLPEQHRIVAKIESLFAKLEEGVAALERAQTNLERYRAAVLKAAVEGRLTEHWREQNPPKETGEQLLDRILAERRKRWEEEQLAKFATKGRKPRRNWKKRYKEPVEPDTDKLADLPEGWCWATVDQVADVIQYGHTASADPSKQDGPRFLRITDIQRGRVRWSDVPGCLASEAVAERYRLSEGDIVFARTGATTGKSYLIEDHPEAIFASYLIRVGLSALVHSRYISVFFQSGAYWAQIERGKRGIGQPNVNARVLAHIILPLPPIREQVEIANQVVYAENAVRQASDRFLRSCLTTAAALRQSILKRAFEGGLVPQDPTNEPASVLLDRISAEANRALSHRIRNDAHQESSADPDTTGSTTGDHTP